MIPELRKDPVIGRWVIISTVHRKSQEVATEILHDTEV
jgi:hypothetical protein